MSIPEPEKVYINSLSYEKLLRHNRVAPAGDYWFQGERGEYWLARMKYLRSLPGGQGRHVEASKAIGWDTPRTREHHPIPEEAGT